MTEAARLIERGGSAYAHERSASKAKRSTRPGETQNVKAMGTLDATDKTRQAWEVRLYRLPNLEGIETEELS